MTRPPRARRRFGPPPRKQRSPWLSGVYALALTVVLLFVLIIGRYASLTLADAILSIAPTPAATSTIDGTVPGIDDDEAILQARNSLWNAIYRAQREALSATAAP